MCLCIYAGIWDTDCPQNLIKRLKKETKQYVKVRNKTILTLVSARVTQFSTWFVISSFLERMGIAVTVLRNIKGSLKASVNFASQRKDNNL